MGQAIVLCMVAPGVRIAVLPAHAPHMGKESMVVRSRSYGISCMMLYRGPQFTQDVAQVPLVLPARRKNIRDTLIADGDIGRDHAGKRAAFAFFDHKPVRDIDRCLCHVDRIDPGHRRAFGDCRKKVTKPLAPGVDLHLAPEVLYRARDPVLTGPCIHKRAEPDTLHDAANEILPCFCMMMPHKFIDLYRDIMIGFSLCRATSELSTIP